MRRFLQFLFTVAMGAALLFLFAGKRRPAKTESIEPAKQSSREMAVPDPEGSALH